MAENVYHDILTVEKGKINVYHNTIGVFEVLSDINNDFRTREYWILNDINNDIRTIPPQEELLDFNNDFRMEGTFVKIDINNDFRFTDFAITNLNNDFRMVGTVIRGDLDNDFRSTKEILSNIDNKFDIVKLELTKINNKVNSCIEVAKDINNLFTFTDAELLDVSCDFRTKKETKYEFNNDFRMLSPWQVPQAGEIGFQSAGKTEVKVYINSVEQTDTDVDSITINQILNGAATASFNLGRAYDATKPTINTIVEIKYKGILLYKGYITEISPTDSPEAIKISCQDEYWNLNKTKKYFFVGRKPVDADEYYYETINDALVGLGFSSNIGDFIPQPMDLYGKGTSEAISNLVQNSGNFSWFIKPDGTKILWQAGLGNIVDLEPQSLGTNLGLYQVLKHNIRENVTTIVNKLRVLMGNWTITKSSGDVSEGSGSHTYNVVYHERYEFYATPAWDRSLGVLMKNSSDGWGYDNKNPNKEYKNVFKKFWLDDIDPKMESWSDIYPPLVRTVSPAYVQFGGINLVGGEERYLTDGFSIDYGFQAPFGYPLGADELAKPSITFSEPQVIYDLDFYKEATNVRPKTIKLHLWKERKFSYTINSQTSPDDAPIEDPDNPLMFYTAKMGSYPETIIDTLNLSNLSKQDGYIIKDEDGKIIESIPSWDDTEFAKDYANWQLSQTSDKKITGAVDVTIDTMLYYNIDLSKRIKIDGVVDSVNITSITYNFGSFIATLNVESHRPYKRLESIQYRGE